MISQRKALNTLIHTLKQNLFELQERILRAQVFGKWAISNKTVGSFERTSLEELQTDHAQRIKEIEELQAIADQASEEDLRTFINSRNK